VPSAQRVSTRAVSGLSLGGLLLGGALLLSGCGSSATVNPAVPAAEAALAAGDITCVDGRIQAAGSSAQANAITEWVNVYQTACPQSTIDYQPVGSGAGVEAFLSKQVSFAGTDSAVEDEDMADAIERCGGTAALNIPLVGGAIAVVYHLPGVDSLVLDPPTIAAIFASEITRWNDPAIVALNPGVDLPDAAIAQFHRSDSSGTTANFSDYLEATAPDAWDYDTGKEWTAPGGQGARGSDQVSASVAQTPNSIGYVELSYLIDAINTKPVAIDQGAGPVLPTAQNASITLSSSPAMNDDGNIILDIDYTTTVPDAYPISIVTYEIVCTTGLAEDQNPALVAEYLAFAASDSGQELLGQIGYVPLSGDLLTQVRDSVQLVIDGAAR
jgi:phosphate transport system substrate-binding protein